jgi:hypothetical protein
MTPRLEVRALALSALSGRHCLASTTRSLGIPTSICSTEPPPAGGPGSARRSPSAPAHSEPYPSHHDLSNIIINNVATISTTSTMTNTCTIVGSEQELEQLNDDNVPRGALVSGWICVCRG